MNEMVVKNYHREDLLSQSCVRSVYVSIVIFDDDHIGISTLGEMNRYTVIYKRIDPLYPTVLIWGQSNNYNQSHAYIYKVIR